jgi:hypothetical protein
MNAGERMEFIDHLKTVGFNVVRHYYIPPGYGSGWVWAIALSGGVIAEMQEYTTPSHDHRNLRRFLKKIAGDHGFETFAVDSPLFGLASTNSDGDLYTLHIDARRWQ